MTDVIEFLEKAGQDAQLRHGLPGELELALSTAGIPSELHDALLAKDQAALETALGVTPLCAVFFPAKEDEEQDDESEDAPDHDPDRAPAEDTLRAMS